MVCVSVLVAECVVLIMALSSPSHRHTFTLGSLRGMTEVKPEAERLIKQLE